MEDFNREKFNMLVSRLCRKKEYRDEVASYIPEMRKMAEELADKGTLDGYSEEELEEFFEEAWDAYKSLACSALSLAWDGDAPGCSGAVWINELDGVYVIESSDYGPYGPYETLEEALAADTFFCSAHPDISSSTMTHEELVAFAMGSIVPMDNDGFEVMINCRTYVVEHGKLRELEPKSVG